MPDVELQLLCPDCGQGTKFFPVHQYGQAYSLMLSHMVASHWDVMLAHRARFEEFAKDPTFDIDAWRKIQL